METKKKASGRISKINLKRGRGKVWSESTILKGEELFTQLAEAQKDPKFRADIKRLIKESIS